MSESMNEEQIKDLVGRKMRSLLEDVFVTERKADPGDEVLTIDKIREVFFRIESHRRHPRPVTIWCVDRPEWARTLFAMFPKAPQPHDARVGPVSLCGIPFYEFQSIYFNDQSEIVAEFGEDSLKLLQSHPRKPIYPWWCRYPGLWVVMSNGSIHSLIDGQILEPNQAKGGRGA